MKKWLLIYSDGSQHQVLCDSEPNEDTGYDLTDVESVLEISEFKDLASHTYDGTGWVEELSYVKEKALTLLNSKREEASLQFVTEGDGKSVAYLYKKAEVDKSSAFKGQKLKVDFPFAAAEAETTGKTIDEVIDSYKAGILASITGLAQIEAKYKKLSDQIKAANTLSDVPDIETLW